MEALKAVGLTPPSVVAKRSEPKKNLSLAAMFPFKNQSFSSFSNKDCVFSVSRAVQGSLVLLSSAVSSELAKALTYEEALQQSVSGSSSMSDFDVGGVLDSVFSFASDNALLIGGGLAALAVPFVVSRLISNPKPWGVESAKAAYARLGDDADAQLLDIRAPIEIKKVGSPDVRSLKKKPVAVVYKGADKPGFLNKLFLKFKEPENTTLFILDKFDGNSELVAELVTANGFKAAYAIRDGAEGSRGWLNSGLPWILPKKSFIDNFTGAIGDTLGEISDAAVLTFGVAATAGLGILVYTGAQAILQILGSVALVQFVTQKLVFSEDRKKTTQQIEGFFNNEVAPKEFAGDIQEIGKALLPFSDSSKALPAPEPTPVVNSVPRAEVQDEALPILPRPLSPYPNYPDYKPPSSPMPL